MISDIKIYVAEELRKLRAARRETIEEASKNIGISKDTLCRYEKGSSQMYVDVLYKILNYYNVEFDIFFANYNANKH